MENQQQLRSTQNTQRVNSNQQDTENTISLRDIVFLVINNWYWFALSLFICLVVVALVYKSKPKEYEYKTTILVRDESGRGNYQPRNMDAIFNSMGMDNGWHSLENEIYLIKSTAITRSVVENLELNKGCERNGLFTKISYYRDRPIEMKVYSRPIDVNTTSSSEVSLVVNVTPIDQTSYEYSVASINGYKMEKKGKAHYTDRVKLNKEGSVEFSIDKTQYYSQRNYKVTYIMSETPIMSKANQLAKRIAVSRIDKNASIVSIVYTDNNELRAKEVVDAVVVAYNEDGINDKKAIAEKTEQFVSERIALISGQLEDVDSQVEQLKKSTGLPDLNTASGTILQTGTRYLEQVNSLEAELLLIKSIKDYLNNPANKDELIPVNVGISDGGVQGMISQYNNQLLQYRKLLNNAGPNNPQVRTLVQRMEANRSNIISSVDNLINTVSVRLHTAKSQQARAQGQIYAMPTQTKAVDEVTREQKI